MYTKLEDAKHAKRVMDFIQANPNCIRKEIIKRCFLNATRLAYLAKEGLIKLPEPLPYGERNGLKSHNSRNERENQNEVSISM